MSRIRILAALGVVAVSLAVGATGCGDDSGGESGSEGTKSSSQSGAAKGAPVKFFQIYQQGGGTLSQDYHRMNGAARAAVESINKQGGYAGRPVELSSCDDGGNAEESTACVRKGISEKPLAFLSSSSLFTPALGPVIEKAGLPYVGGWLNNRFDAQNPNGYPITHVGEINWQAMMFAAKAVGRKKVACAALDIATAIDLCESALAVASKAGVEDAGLIKVPVAATDMSPFVQAAKDDGADTVLLVLSKPQVVGFTRAATTLKADFKFGLQSSGGYARTDLKQYGDQADNFIGAGAWPPSSDCGATEACKKFTEDMNAAIESGAINNMDDDSDIDSDAFMGWIDMWTMKFFFDKHPEAIESPQALKKALDSETEGVKVFDLFTWTPGAAGPKGFEKQPRAEVFLTQFKDGGWTLLEPDAVNIYEKTGVR